MSDRTGPWREGRRRLAIAVACSCLWFSPGAVRAQSASTELASPVVAEPDAGTPRREHATRLYFGMWTTHLREDVLVLDNNWLIGLSTRGFFGATFLNSFGH